MSNLSTQRTTNIRERKYGKGFRDMRHMTEAIKSTSGLYKSVHQMVPNEMCSEYERLLCYALYCVLVQAAPEWADIPTIVNKNHQNCQHKLGGAWHAIPAGRCRKMVFDMLDLNLKQCSWMQLVRDAGWTPLMASFFMLYARGGENVVLDGVMLEWTKKTKETFSEEKCCRRTIPLTTPTDPTFYRQLEYMARKLQRTFFMYASAQEADALIRRMAWEK